MKRRTFLSAVAALAAVRLGYAQPGVRRIGIIRTSKNYPERYAALAEGLRQFGWVEGRNLVIEWRDTDGDNSRAKVLAESLVAARLDLILTNTTQAVALARSATSSVPIVAAAFGDPVASGLVKSLSKPGGNVTGVSVDYDGIGDKVFELAVNALGNPKRFAFLSNPDNPASVRAANGWKALAQKRPASMLELWPRSLPELEAALATIARSSVEALLVAVQPFFLSHRRLIADRMRAARVPAFGQTAEYVDAGLLASYGPDFRAAFRIAARYVDSILKGAKPAELPVEQLSQLELVVNLQTAKAIGVTVPRSVLLRADRAIE